MYKTVYENINNIDFKDALKIYKNLDHGSKIDPNCFDLENYDNVKEVIISLAKRVAELEHEWS